MSTIIGVENFMLRILKRYEVLWTSMFIIFSSTAILSAEGSKLFFDLGCHSCHDAVKDQIKRGLGPSISMIKDHYKGNSKNLIKFLKGKKDPIVYPNRFVLMKQQLEKIKSISDEDKNALAEFLLK